MLMNTAITVDSWQYPEKSWVKSKIRQVFHIPNGRNHPHLFSAMEKLGFHSEYCKAPTALSIDPEFFWGGHSRTLWKKHRNLGLQEL